ARGLSARFAWVEGTRDAHTTILFVSRCYPARSAPCRQKVPCATSPTALPQPRRRAHAVSNPGGERGHVAAPAGNGRGGRGCPSQVNGEDAVRRRGPRPRGGIAQHGYTEGRLSKDEYDARLESALSARIYADVDQVVTDLPVAPATAVTPVAKTTVVTRW